MKWIKNQKILNKNRPRKVVAFNLIDDIYLKPGLSEFRIVFAWSCLAYLLDQIGINNDMRSQVSGLFDRLT